MGIGLTAAPAGVPAPVCVHSESFQNFSLFAH